MSRSQKKKSILDPKKVEGKNKEQKSMQTPNIKWRQSTNLTHDLKSGLNAVPHVKSLRIVPNIVLT